MARKKHKGGDTSPIWHVSAEEATLHKMPRYNGFACGHGAHGDVKYNRSKQKRFWKRELNGGGTRRNGSLLFHASRAIAA